MELYPHQNRVYDLLERGENVILRAPTGAGKTQASLYPFLVAMDKTSDIYGKLPRKCIYSVPMRVLAKQFFVEYDNVVKRYNTRYNTTISTTIQTGDMPQDRELTRDLIFATIDQTLSNFLMAPYGLSRGRANLNLGAILSSYLVFDEFHLYSPDSTLPTTLQMLRMLKGITPFVLMTATFSDKLLNRLAEKLDAKVVGLNEQDCALFNQLASQQKTRRYHAVQAPLSPDPILDVHQGRSIVICNTVKRAQALTSQLRSRSKDTEVILLHSRFLKEDRDRIEDEIQARFGEKADPSGSVIVVATQAIEVGVDITSTVMHSELAPANSIIQRAGRCARYKGDTGDVYIYRYVKDAHGDSIDLYENHRPYEGKLSKEQICTTFEAFQENGGAALDFSNEQAIINHVHSKADEEILKDLDLNSANYRSSIFATMRGDRDQANDLVRKVIAQPITIHADPDMIEDPFGFPSFSVHPGSLKGFIADWLEQYHDIENDETVPPFSVKYLISETDPDNSTKQISSWQTVHKSAEEVPYGALVAVHPEFASYRAADGFLPHLGGGWEVEPATEMNRKSTLDPYTYQLETYNEHIKLVYKAAFEDDAEIGHRAYWYELEWAVNKLSKHLGLTFEQIKQAAELTILLHDVGKLSTGWQGWIRQYQRKIGEGNQLIAGEAYAHSTYQAELHSEIQKSMGKRPPHAVESAVASIPVIARLPKETYCAVLMAICRHHGAFTKDYTPFTLEPGALNQVNKTLESPVQSLSDGKLIKEASQTLFINPRDSTLNKFFLYAVFVRLLRRADTKGTSWGSSRR